MTDTLDPAAAAAETPALEPAAGEAQPDPALGQEGSDAPAPAPAPQSATETPHWSRGELRKSQEANKRLQRELDETRRQIAELQNRPEAPPHVLDDPDGFIGSIDQRLTRLQENTRLERSEDRARDKHGDDFVDEVNEWLMSRRDVVEWARGHRDPWGKAIEVFKREQLAAEIGDDPTAYRAKLEAEFRAKFEAEQSALAQPNSPATPAPRIPTPASQVRSAAPKSGAYAGPAPISDLTKNKF